MKHSKFRREETKKRRPLIEEMQQSGEFQNDVDARVVSWGVDLHGRTEIKIIR